jgi:mono/diheme cytochrome c family protein/plastocyanin
MTDTPGREPERHEPEPEQRLPVPRPPAEGAPVERFTAPPSIRKIEFSPERAAQVVRQSANARWVGFLAVVIVILFVSIYWFYELGFPAGISQSRLEAETEAQQVTAVERGYNVYEANCARCHGVDGEGGIGPALNRQDKLFAHLNEDYLRNILQVGGRLACGDPNSIMPVWADSGHPPGPLNYRQIDELIAFLRAPSDQTYTRRHPELLDALVDPVTGEIQTFTGWRDPNYAPEPGSTPYPACWQDEFTGGGGGGGDGGGGASPTPAASRAPDAAVVTVVAEGIAFTTPDVTVPADTPFVLTFENRDAGIPHDVTISDAAGTQVFKTDTFNGVETREYDVPALAAGAYPFICSVHPNMTGTLTAE